MRLNQRFPKSLKSVAERHRHSAPLGRYIMRPKAVYHMQRIYHTAKLYIIVKHGRTSLLPHFATGYHAFGLKIATAAMRPRNDRKTVGFFIKPTVFVFTMFEICRGATPPRRFPGSAISRGRKPAFHMRSIFHSAEGRISLRSQILWLRYAPTVCCTRSLLRISRSTPSAETIPQVRSIPPVPIPSIRMPPIR